MISGHYRGLRLALTREMLHASLETALAFVLILVPILRSLTIRDLPQ